MNHKDAKGRSSVAAVTKACHRGRGQASRASQNEVAIVPFAFYSFDNNDGALLYARWRHTTTRHKFPAHEVSLVENV
jgi:hypothetical protein